MTLLRRDLLDDDDNEDRGDDQVKTTGKERRGGGGDQKDTWSASNSLYLCLFLTAGVDPKDDEKEAEGEDDRAAPSHEDDS